MNQSNHLKLSVTSGCVKSHSIVYFHCFFSQSHTTAILQNIHRKGLFWLCLDTKFCSFIPPIIKSKNLKERMYIIAKQKQNSLLDWF